MNPHPFFDRDECNEQAYFFRVFRERIAEQMPAQEILSRIHEEILSTTKLPMAVQFLASEIKHSGLLSSGFARLPHYFTPFQSFMIRQSEDEKRQMIRSGFPLGWAACDHSRKYRFRTNVIRCGPAASISSPLSLSHPNWPLSRPRSSRASFTMSWGCGCS